MSGTIRLHLRVSPGAARAAVVGRHGEAWKLRVCAPAEHGRANEAVVALLAETLELARADVAIVSGHTARNKVASLAGLERVELERRLGLAAERGQEAGG